jgi:hypothetical protein
MDVKSGFVSRTRRAYAVPIIYGDLIDGGLFAREGWMVVPADDRFGAMAEVRRNSGYDREFRLSTGRIHEVLGELDDSLPYKNTIIDSSHSSEWFNQTQ